MPTDDASLIALEERFCHQEQLLQQLDAALQEQQRTVDRLAARIVRLEQTAVSHAERLTQSPPHEPPPHY